MIVVPLITTLCVSLEEHDHDHSQQQRMPRGLVNQKRGNRGVIWKICKLVSDNTIGD